MNVLLFDAADMVGQGVLCESGWILRCSECRQLAGCYRVRATRMCGRSCTRICGTQRPSGPISVVPDTSSCLGAQTVGT